MGRILARLGVLIPDELYLYLKFRYEMGEWPNLSNPKTFNEKLNWLKLHNRNPEYTRMVDKLLVKEYVCSRLNPQIIIPTIAVWDTPEQIEWDKLPDRFVLKTTHGGGGNSVIICKDKSSLDIQAALRKLKKPWILIYIRHLENGPIRMLFIRFLRNSIWTEGTIYMIISSFVLMGK